MRSFFARMTVIASGLASGLAASFTASARAADEARPTSFPSSQDDATYGRIDGDLAVVVGAGVAVGPRSPRGAVDLRFRYIDTAGIFVTYEDGKIFGDGAEPLRVIAAGVELRPLFLGRWLTGREIGNGRVDLLIDSFGIELGGFFAQPVGGSLGSRPGLQVGLALELPILAHASGPFIGLHGGVRWGDSALSGEPITLPSDRAAYLAITLAWHQVFGGHVVDARDTAPR
jgi:hypothetical protein